MGKPIELIHMVFNKFMAEFKDRQLETEFARHDNAETLGYIRPAVFLLGILFFLFIIPDYYMIESRGTFRLIFLTRSIFILLVTILYIHMKYKPAFHFDHHLIPAYELLVSVCFLLIYYNYETPNFFIQSLGAVALIFVFFQLSNRWLYALLISLFLGAGFFMVTLARPDEVASMDLAAISTYLALFTVLGSISSYRINLYKRIQFVNTRELLRLSETDTLTGIYTRDKFDRELKIWIDVAERYRQPLSIIMFDLDDLKMINDIHGHLEGDRVLSKIATLVQGVLRKTDVFARWGGDEFVILLPYTEKRQALELAERIRKLTAGHGLKQAGVLSCSFGVEELGKGDDSSSLLSRVDKRLYEAKKSGKNQVR